MQDAQSAQRSAKQLRSFGGRLRSLFDGLRVSKVRAAVASEFRERIDQAQRLLEGARTEARAERERRREAEIKATASTEALRALASQRNDAWREVQHLMEELSRYRPKAAGIETGYRPK